MEYSTNIIGFPARIIPWKCNGTHNFMIGHVLRQLFQSLQAMYFVSAHLIYREIMSAASPTKAIIICQHVLKIREFTELAHGTPFLLLQHTNAIIQDWEILSSVHLGLNRCRKSRVAECQREKEHETRVRSETSHEYMSRQH